MKTITVIPTKEIAGIKFGQKREDVRKAFGAYKEFKKNRFSKNTSDDFGYCHAYYNDRNELTAVEFFNDVSILVDEKKIFPIGSDDIKQMIDDLKGEDESLISESLSIGITVNDGKTKSILFGGKGYYD